MPDFEALLGKHVLAGITFLDADENVRDQLQFHGRVTASSREDGIVIERADGSGPYRLPPDPERFHPAEPAEYRLCATGEVVVNPDYTTTWTVHARKKPN